MNRLLALIAAFLFAAQPLLAQQTGGGGGSGLPAGGTASNMLIGTPAWTTVFPNGMTGTTQATGDSTLDVATNQFVALALQGVNPASAVNEATAVAVLPNTPTYANGSAGVGATLTSATNTALVVDGVTVALNDRVLVKDQAAPAQDGVYTETQVGTGSVPWILTRATDYNTAANINYTGTIPVISGTVNALTNWLLVSTITTIGTDSITYTQQTSGAGITTGGNIKCKPPLTKGQVIIGQGGTSCAVSPSIVVDANNSANLVPGSPIATTAVGYLGAPLNEQDGNYTFVLGDAGKTVRASISSGATYTIPTNASVAYPLGTILVARNAPGSTANLTIAPAGGVNLYQAGVTFSASLVEGAGSLVAIEKEATNDWMVTGVTGTSGMVLIQTVITAGAQTNVTFSSIPGNYTHLIIKVQARSATSATDDALIMQFNGDTGTNYDQGFNTIIAGAVSFGSAVAQGAINIGNLPAATDTANIAGEADGSIDNYSSSTFFKTYVGQAWEQRGNTAATASSQISTNGLWRNTAAITSIKISFNTGAAFVNGSAVSLYGVP